MRSPVDCPDIIIANGQTVSNTVLVDKVHADADDVMLMCSTIDGGKIYTIQVNDQRDGTGTWYTLNDGTADITPQANANKASVYPFLNHTFRITANAAVATQCLWKMKKTYSVGTGIDSD